MKNLLSLIAIFLFTACAQPKNNLPPPALDPKYFKRDKLYPYMYLKDGYLEYIPAGGLDYRTRKPLPPINSPYWGNAKAFSNEYDQISIRVPITFKNTGKVLAYTNSSGGIFLNEEEILVEPEELTALINKYPAFFEHYPYEETLFAYTNFAANFTKDFTNIRQVYKDRQKHQESNKGFRIEWQKMEKQLGGFDEWKWRKLYQNFSHYITPQLSLRSFDVLGLEGMYTIHLSQTTGISRDGEDLSETSVFLYFFPKTLKEFQVAALNLIILDLYDPFTPTSNVETPKLAFSYFPTRDSYPLHEATGLYEGWPPVQIEKQFPSF